MRNTPTPDYTDHADRIFSGLAEEMMVELSEARTRGLYRARRKLSSAQGPHVHWRGREFLNFSANDYLNLASDIRLARSAAHAARRYGTGSSASPLISGYLPPLRRLERSLAAWEKTAAALVFNSGFAANLGVITALAGPEDAVLSDALNHASLIDGCRLSRARIHVYRHTDVNHLEELLRREGKEARRRLIVTDSVFSMDGDWAPLPDLLDLARRCDAWLLIDEAHASGVFGESGRGLAELLLPDSEGSDPRLIKIGTLSKALGSQGGFVCGSETLIDWLVNMSRPYVFSTALAPPAAAAARRAVAIVQEEPERRQHLLALGDYLRVRLRDAGFADAGSRSQIVPVMVGDAREAVELSNRLADNGLLVPAIRPPSVPEGGSRLRISLCAGHTVEDVHRLVDQLQDCSLKKRRLNPGGR
jgi:8-amino-7-oxononanoate synthase